MSLRKFSKFKELSSEVKAVLNQQGFHTATPVQDATIPLFCGHKDVAVDACTGSGKTLAFVLPIVEKLRRLEEPLKKHQVGALVVSPTRELAKQIAGVAEPFVQTLNDTKMLLLVGGRSPAEDVAAFLESGAQIIIGTPGRIDDVMKRCSRMDWKKLEVLVLDEADRLLDMGFKQQLDAIMARLPKQRRTGLFSATQTDAVGALARAGLRNPVRVNVTVSVDTGPSKNSKWKGGDKDDAGTDQGLTQKTPQSLRLYFVCCESHEKLPQLVQLLQQKQGEKIMVYLLTCLLVEFYGLMLQRLRQSLSSRGVHLPPVWALHGKMKQAQRESTLGKFTEAESGCLLCTDLAARGLDIPDVNWIVQLDPPQNPDQFVHRVGRTARMGRSGDAMLYLLPHETTYVEFLQLRKVPLQEGSLLPSAQDLTPLIRMEAETDREVMEKGTKALVSYVRAYKEHQCKYIFRIQDLDLGYLATALGVLRIPRLPDIRKPKGLEHFIPSAVDPTTVKFKDKAREKQRQQVQKQKQQAQPEAKPAKGQQAVSTDKSQQVGKLTAAKRRQLQQREELMELEHEYHLLKKLKKGKISHHQFDVATGVSDTDESDGMDKLQESSCSEDDSEDEAGSKTRIARSKGKQGAGSQGSKGKQGAGSQGSKAVNPAQEGTMEGIGKETGEEGKGQEKGRKGSAMDRNSEGGSMEKVDLADEVEDSERQKEQKGGGHEGLQNRRCPHGKQQTQLASLAVSQGAKKKKKKKLEVAAVRAASQLGEGVLQLKALLEKAKRKDRRMKKAAKRKAKNSTQTAAANGS